jgi:hypothetical protein
MGDQLLAEEFEQIAAFAERQIETVRLELLRGRIGLRKATNGSHGAAVMWLVDQWMQGRPELGLYPSRGLKVEAHGQVVSCRTASWHHGGTSSGMGTGLTLRVC